MQVRFGKGVGLRGLAFAAIVSAGIAAVGIPAAAFAVEEVPSTEMPVQNEVGDSPATEESDAGLPATDRLGEAAVSGGAATAPEARPSNAPTLTAPATRQITGTVRFDPLMTQAQKENISVGATHIASDDDPGTPVDPSQVTFDAVTGEYAVVGVAPGRYKIGVQLHDPASGWNFSPGDEPATSWDSLTTSSVLGSSDVDVTDADSLGGELFFDPAFGGISFRVHSTLSADVRVIATNAANGETADLYAIGSGGSIWGNRTAFERTLVSGTKVTVRVETAGAVVYYDGTRRGTANAADATLFTVPVFSGLNIGDLDMSSYIAPGQPSIDDLVDGTRRDVVVPSNAPSGETLRVFVGKNYAGAVVYGWMFSTPTLLTPQGVEVGNDGYVSVKLPAQASGDHRIVIAAHTGWVIGWGNVTIKGSELANTGGASPVALSAIAGGLILAGALITTVRRKQLV